MMMSRSQPTLNAFTCLLLVRVHFIRVPMSIAITMNRADGLDAHAIAILVMSKLFVVPNHFQICNVVTAEQWQFQIAVHGMYAMYPFRRSTNTKEEKRSSSSKQNASAHSIVVACYISICSHMHIKHENTHICRVRLKINAKSHTFSILNISSVSWLPFFVPSPSSVLIQKIVARFLQFLIGSFM